MEMTKLKMHDPSKVKCPHVTLFEQLKRLLSTKQNEDEPLIECTKKFKQVQDNVKSIMGTECPDKFTENMEEHINKTENDTRLELKKQSNKSFMACMFCKTVMV